MLGGYSEFEPIHLQSGLGNVISWLSIRSYYRIIRSHKYILTGKGTDT